MFIGEKEVLQEVYTEGEDNVELHFTDTVEGEPVLMQRALYDLIKSETVGSFGVTDAVNHKLAAEFVARMASLGLEYYFVENVAMAMRTLSHNARETLLRKTFKCSGGDAIRLDTVLNALE